MNLIYTITLTFLFSFGSDKIENISILGPQALSIDLQGDIYITDTGNNRVLKFNSNGQFIKAIGGFGWEKEQFDTPVDICATSVLDIFIADYNNQRIERYDKDLNYIASLYSDDSKSEDLQFGYPRGISISIHGELIIIDSENNRLLKINSFGNPEMSFGDFAEGKGKLDNPFQIEISSDDKIYVSDNANNTIVVFDYFGNYLTEIGNGIVKGPTGIFLDENNRLWVASSGNREICAFTTQGDLSLKSKTINAEIGEFKNPIDIIASGQKIYVLDDNLIYAFEIKGSN